MTKHFATAYRRLTYTTYTMYIKFLNWAAMYIKTPRLMYVVYVMYIVKGCDD